MECISVIDPILQDSVTPFYLEDKEPGHPIETIQQPEIKNNRNVHPHIPLTKLI